MFNTLATCSAASFYTHRFIEELSEYRFHFEIEKEEGVRELVDIEVLARIGKSVTQPATVPTGRPNSQSTARTRNARALD